MLHCRYINSRTIINNLCCENAPPRDLVNVGIVWHLVAISHTSNGFWPKKAVAGETFEKCLILIKSKEGDNFNYLNTLRISRITIWTWRQNWPKGSVFQRSRPIVSPKHSWICRNERVCFPSTQISIAPPSFASATFLHIAAGVSRARRSTILKGQRCYDTYQNELPFRDFC